MTRTFSAFVIATGAITGQRVGSNEDEGSIADLLAKHTRAGNDWIEAMASPLSQKVQAVDGVNTLVDWQPPAPADTAYRTYAWNATAKRWAATPTLAWLKIVAIEPLKTQLNDLDAKLVRPNTEISAALAAGTTPAADDVTRLNALRAQKDVLRARIEAINAATTPEEVAAA